MLYRSIAILAAALVVCHNAIGLCAEQAFSFAALKDQAHALALKPHIPPARAPDAFLKLDYDRYRLIAARNENALWRDAGLPFWAEFFLAGFIYEYPVEINVVDETGNVEQLAAGPKWFQFRGAAKSLESAPGAGFSGFRLLTQLGENPEKTEFLVFQGASYFRGRGAQQIYGASARALAIDVGLPSPEEFPRFTKFWIERPRNDAKAIRVWALMDSAAEAGACQFKINPGETLSMDVETHVWFRHGVQKVGIAPITSMWMWDASNKPADDPRPEVHDSDGLLIQAGPQDWTWRPLNRPKSPRVSRWPVKKLAGFGLMQRDRDPNHYRDDEAKYPRRPSIWVTPANDWGAGHVELLELPAETEGMDNVGAYWVSDQKVTPGSNLSFQYRLSFGEGPAGIEPECLVTDSRVKPANDAQMFEIEFTSGDTPAGSSIPRPKITCDDGAIENIEFMPQANGRLLVRFVFRPANLDNAQLQAQLRTETESVSETWSYQWTRN